jgi:hypothetical protein
MKPLLYLFLLGILIPLVSFGQTVQTGFAVITPIAGTGDGLSITETFGELVGTNFFQASVIGSPLVTLTDVIVNIDPALGLNTGVAMVNPNNSPATVTFTLGNQVGAAVDTRTITLSARQQISMFVTEIFSGSPAVASPMTGLMFVNASLPIGVLGLSFNGFSFTSLPVATQITVATVNTVSTTLPTVTTVTNPTITTVLGGAASTSPIPTTITQIPATFPGLASQQSGTTVTTPVIGVIPTGTVTTVSPIVPVSTTVTGVTGTVTTPLTTVAGVAPAFTFPLLTVGIGGPGALLLPQVASGAGWVSQIFIANTSGVAQGVRVDFFTPFGAPFNLSFGSSVPNLVIAPGGVATITTTTLP